MSHHFIVGNLKLPRHKLRDCRKAYAGADLWHLAMTSSLRPDLPEIVLLTFDNALSAAAIGEGMA